MQPERIEDIPVGDEMGQLMPTPREMLIAFRPRLTLRDGWVYWRTHLASIGAILRPLARLFNPRTWH